MVYNDGILETCIIEQISERSPFMAVQKHTRSQFTFYASFYRAIQNLPKSRRLRAYEMLCEYALYADEPGQEAPVLMALFEALRPHLDSSRAKSMGRLSELGGSSTQKVSYQTEDEENEDACDPEPSTCEDLLNKNKEKNKDKNKNKTESKKENQAEHDAEEPPAAAWAVENARTCAEAVETPVDRQQAGQPYDPTAAAAVSDTAASGLAARACLPSVAEKYLKTERGINTLSTSSDWAAFAAPTPQKAPVRAGPEPTTPSGLGFFPPDPAPTPEEFESLRSASLQKLRPYLSSH